jgi:hypothetical protein
MNFLKPELKILVYIFEKLRLIIQNPLRIGGLVVKLAVAIQFRLAPGSSTFQFFRVNVAESNRMSSSRPMQHSFFLR